ncbi:microfibrillar-associated protein 5 isoform X2 [Pelobates fuscus]|uniref:microfibrillar-associated protein 5 isoform X2 n=1 Tax=Pelobates fuscus TaxID=191477 RepID=UPI002FE46F34
MDGLNKGFLCSLLLAVTALAIPEPGFVISRRDVDDGTDGAPAVDDTGSHPSAETGDCREVQYPCTRVYSVQKPVKQCISYLCVTSVRRVYMLNKEICTRIMCKEHEVIQDEKCRQLAGLPPRRFEQPEAAPEEKPTTSEGI